MQVQNYFSMQKGASNQEPVNDSCHNLCFLFRPFDPPFEECCKKPLLKMYIFERKDQIMKIFAVDFAK